MCVLHSFRRLPRRKLSGEFPRAPTSLPVMRVKGPVLCEDANVTDLDLDPTLARARVGDEDAFRDLTDPYRRELQLHIYRIVGSAQDAEDLLQESLLAAWRGVAQFQGRASVRGWLYRIATNRSLDALRANRRRPEDQRMTQLPEPTRWYLTWCRTRLKDADGSEPRRELRQPSRFVRSLPPELTQAVAVPRS
jgi:RNA polymerase sigma-70 factor (ECF subfamily)